MCSGLGGCSGGLTSFGPAASAEISLKKSQVGCLSGPPATTPPTLAGLSPSSTPAIASGLIFVSGSALEWVHQVTVGAQTYTPTAGLVVVDDDTLYVAGPAVAPSIGSQSVVATNPIGSSNALSFTYTESHPPVLQNQFYAVTGTDYAWKMGGEVSDLWFLRVSVGDDSTFPLFGYPLLVNGLLVGSGLLDSVGVAEHALFLPPSGVGLAFFSQVATIDGGTGTFRGASVVKASFVLI
jgi:hypothetical protein